MISLLENYFVLQALVVATLFLVVTMVSWIFMRYATSPIPFPLSRVAHRVLTGALLLFGGIVINKLYPVSFLRIIVPATLCAVVIHSIIIIFNLHVYYVMHQTLLRFPKFLALCINYTFFAVISLLMMYHGGANLELFFYYLTEAVIKIGVLAILYLLMRTQVYQIREKLPEQVIVHEQYNFGNENDYSKSE